MLDEGAPQLFLDQSKNRNATCFKHNTIKGNIQTAGGLKGASKRH